MGPRNDHWDRERVEGQDSSSRELWLANLVLNAFSGYNLVGREMGLKYQAMSLEAANSIAFRFDFIVRLRAILRDYKKIYYQSTSGDGLDIVLRKSTIFFLNDCFQCAYK